MGYRHYFCKVKKADVEKVKYLSLEQLKEQFPEDDDNMWIENIIDHEQIFEFGKNNKVRQIVVMKDIYMVVVLTGKIIRLLFLISMQKERLLNLKAEKYPLES